MGSTGILITTISRIQQVEENSKKYRLLDNSLYWDEDGTLYLVPRNFISDGYTIPNWVAWIAGGKMEHDLRPAHFHDFFCQYHAAIRVKTTMLELRKAGLVRKHYDKDTNKWFTICDDIPTHLLEYVPMTKWETDCAFKRLMKATKRIKHWRVNLMRGGVFFNVGWVWSGKKAYDLEKCYKVQDE